MKAFLLNSNTKATHQSKVLHELQSKNLLTTSEVLQLNEILEMASSSCVPGQEVVTSVHGITDSIINDEDASPIAVALAAIAADIRAYCTATIQEARIKGRL